MPIPNFTDTSLTEEEGVIDSQQALSGGLDEAMINKIIGDRIDKGKSFYDSKLNLTKVRENNEKRWLNKNREVAGYDLYDYQIPYEDNRIFVSIETLTTSLVPRIPVPEVTEAQDTEASRELASNFGSVLLRTAQGTNLRSHLRMATRHVLMGYRAGIIKCTWDFSKGIRKQDGTYMGTPEAHYVRPHKVVIDADATDPNDIPLIAETLTKTVEELIIDFPEKKTEILQIFSGSDEVDEEKMDLGTRVNYTEIWFTFYDEGHRMEGVAWKYQNTLLGWGLNPYFNYSEDEGTNFLDRPTKPYVFFNFLSAGRWVYDDTSLTEQAASQQDILEKRGLQIVDNADQANAAKIWNTEMIDASDAERYVGDPNDNILAKGDVRQAFARVPAPSLPRYVIEDKYDARNEIDNIFGTHGPLRGEKTESPTLGQEVLSQRSDLGRTTALSEAVEEGATKVYRLLTQLFKVFASEEHLVKYLGEDGKTAFIRFSSDKIEDGVEINVQAGSLAPEDKLSDRNELVEMIRAGQQIDPLTFAEKWHLSKPREIATRIFQNLFMPEEYARDILGMGSGGGDGDAMATIQQINTGENVPAKKDATKDYLAYYNQFLQSPAFKQLDPEVKQLHILHVRETAEVIKGGLKDSGSEEDKKRLGPLSVVASSLKKRFLGK